MLPQKAVPEPARPRSTNPATNRPRGVSGVYVAAISRSSCLSQRRAEVGPSRSVRLRTPHASER